LYKLLIEEERVEAVGTKMLKSLFGLKGEEVTAE
jgi:hypothetical protein